MKIVSDKNYKTHKTVVIEEFNAIVFLECDTCLLKFVLFGAEIYSECNESCNDYIIKSIIE